jgi:hypothetical protein
VSPEQAVSILNDQNVQNCAIVLAAMDRLQADAYGEMEIELHKIGQFSESTVMTATDRALQAYTFIAIPGNGNGIKVALSIFLRGLQLLHRDDQVQLSLNAVETLEIIDTQ